MKFQAALSDANRVIDSLGYLSALHWNRLYRIPVADRDPLTFNIEEDSLDQLIIKVSDLGNSGGLQRKELSVTNSMDIRVLAVNNKPQALAPSSVLAYEDRPYVFNKEIQVADPDSQDFGYSSRLLTANLSAIHGRLYLNEDVLQDPISKIELLAYQTSQQEYRGLYYDPPKYGNKCQFQGQCSDDSKDTKYGFYATAWYGVVYSPLTAGSDAPTQGCGICPEDTGNKFISIRGNIEALNNALSTVTYLPDPNFNTRYGIAEQITFSINDNGALGEKGAPSLSDSTVINVVVESVNDKPIIGRRILTSIPLTMDSTYLHPKSLLVKRKRKSMTTKL